MTNISNPGLVSVIIPTYYRNEFLTAAIGSLINQSYQNLEIIVIDDSGEGHAETTVRRISKNYSPRIKIKYIELEKNCGPQIARQKGLEIADGEFIQFFDDDDKLHRESIERRINLISTSPNVGVVYSGTEYGDGSVVLPSPDARGDVLKLALQFRLSPCTTSNMLIENSILRQFTPLTDTYTGAGDIAIQIELAKRTQFDYISEPLLWSRRTEGSLGVSNKAVRSRLQIIRDYSDLYNQYDLKTRKFAISDTYILMGRDVLNEKIWSPVAIAAFIKAAYFAPEIKLYHLGELISALGGRPLRSAIRYFKS